MERLKLTKRDNKIKKYSRQTAKKALHNVVKKIIEANQKEEFIYKVVKAVLFGSYINSNKEKIGDLDIAIYLKLKNKNKPEIEQNIERSKSSKNEVPFLAQYYYGKDEIAKYIKDKKHILQIHDGIRAEKEAKEFSDKVCYIYSDKYKIIYELHKEN